MYLSKIDKLTEEDKNRLTKKILYLKNRNYCKDIKLKNISYKLLVGDIIKVYNKFYLILDITNKIVCFNLRYKDKITINDIKDKKISYIEKNSFIKYINSVDDKLLKSVLKKYQNLLYIKNNNAIPPRGSIIEYNENYYYIYGSEGRELLAIEIRLNFKKTYKELKLSNKIIYTKFEEYKINKNNKFSILELLNSSDIETIKYARKNSKKVVKKEKILKNESIKIGSIITVTNNFFETFIITNIIDNIIECQSTIDKTANKLYFDKDKVKLAK